MNDFLYFCPTCKMIYEILRHRVRPPAEPVCDGCQQDLPVAEDGEWLTGQPALDLTTQHSVTCPPLSILVMIFSTPIPQPSYRTSDRHRPFPGRRTSNP